MLEPPLSIASDGDAWEKLYWQAFASERFPSCEDFWLAHVVPLTNRRATDRLSNELRIRFRTDAELAADGRGHEDVAIAQLHYTLLLHIGPSGSYSTIVSRSPVPRVGGRASTSITSSRASRD